MNVALLDVVLFFSAQPAQLHAEVLTPEPRLLSYTGGTCTAESVPIPLSQPSTWAGGSSVFGDGYGGGTPGSHGGLPSRSSMAPASMMSSSSSSSGPSSSWVFAEVPHFRRRPFFPAVAAAAAKIREACHVWLSALHPNPCSPASQAAIYAPGRKCRSRMWRNSVALVLLRYWHILHLNCWTTTTSIMASRLCRSGSSAPEPGGGCAGELGLPRASSGGSRHVDVGPSARASMAARLWAKVELDIGEAMGAPGGG